MVVGLLEDRNCLIRFAEFGRNGAEGTISHIDCSVFGWEVSSEWFGSLKGMHVVLEYSHDTELIEVRNPMEQAIHESLRINIEVGAAAIHGNMVVSEPASVSGRPKTINEELLLEPT